MILVVSSPSTTVVPAAALPVDRSMPTLDVPLRPRPVGGIRSSIGVRPASPGQPKRPDEIPLPVRILAGGASSNPTAPDSRPTEQRVAIPQNASSEADAAIDWLLKGERRHHRGRSGGRDQQTRGAGNIVPATSQNAMPGLANN